MAEYINIKGTNRQVLSSDPSNPTLGQIWYNTTSNTLKGRVLQSSAWATANSMTTARRSYGYAGTQTAALAAGGGYPAISTTEEYGGTSWTTVNSMPTSVYDLAGAGLQTAAVIWGGDSNVTYEYDGTNWTTSGTLGIAVRNSAGFGIQTAAVSTGGQSLGNPYTSATEEYNGSSWTGGNNLAQQRSRLMGFGTLTAGVATGGTTDEGLMPNTEEYDGTSWTAGGNLNTARKEAGSSIGTQTAAIVFGGIIPSSSPNDQALTEKYDGTSFANDATMGTARAYLRGMGSATAGLAAGGGGDPGNSAVTEEYTGAAEATVTIDPV